MMAFKSSKKKKTVKLSFSKKKSFFGIYRKIFFFIFLMIIGLSFYCYFKKDPPPVFISADLPPQRIQGVSFPSSSPEIYKTFDKKKQISKEILLSSSEIPFLKPFPKHPTSSLKGIERYAEKIFSSMRSGKKLTFEKIPPFPIQPFPSHHKNLKPKENLEKPLTPPSKILGPFSKKSFAEDKIKELRDMGIAFKDIHLQRSRTGSYRILVFSKNI